MGVVDEETSVLNEVAEENEGVDKMLNSVLYCKVEDISGNVWILDTVEEGSELNGLLEEVDRVPLDEVGDSPRNDCMFNNVEELNGMLEKVEDDTDGGELIKTGYDCIELVDEDVVNGILEGVSEYGEMEEYSGNCIEVVDEEVVNEILEGFEVFSEDKEFIEVEDSGNDSILDKVEDVVEECWEVNGNSEEVVEDIKATLDNKLNREDDWMLLEVKDSVVISVLDRIEISLDCGVAFESVDPWIFCMLGLFCIKSNVGESVVWLRVSVDSDGSDRVIKYDTCVGINGVVVSIDWIFLVKLSANVVLGKHGIWVAFISCDTEVKMSEGSDEIEMFIEDKLKVNELLVGNENVDDEVLVKLERFKYSFINCVLEGVVKSRIVDVFFIKVECVDITTADCVVFSLRVDSVVLEGVGNFILDDWLFWIEKDSEAVEFNDAIVLEGLTEE